MLITALQMEALYWIIESVINKSDYKRYLHQREEGRCRRKCSAPNTWNRRQSLGQRRHMQTCLMMRSTGTTTITAKWLWRPCTGARRRDVDSICTKINLKSFHGPWLTALEGYNSFVLKVRASVGIWEIDVMSETEEIKRTCEEIAGEMEDFSLVPRLRKDSTRDWTYNLPEDRLKKCDEGFCFHAVSTHLLD